MSSGSRPIRACIDHYIIVLCSNRNFNPPLPVLGVGLVSSSFTVNETDGYLTVGVEILEGSLELEQSVLISTQAGTATPGTCMHGYCGRQIYTRIGSLTSICGLVYRYCFTSLPVYTANHGIII